MRDWWMRLCRDAKVSYTFAAVQLAFVVTLLLMGSWLYAVTWFLIAGFLAVIGTHEQTIADLRMELRIERSVTTILRWGHADERARVEAGGCGCIDAAQRGEARHCGVPRRRARRQGAL